MGASMQMFHLMRDKIEHSLRTLTSALHANDQMKSMTIIGGKRLLILLFHQKVEQWKDWPI